MIQSVTRNRLPFCPLLSSILRFDTYNMDGGGRSLQTYPIPPALADNLGLFQYQLVGAGDHDAVAGALHVVQSGGDLVVLALDVGQLGEQSQQISVIPDGEAGLLRDGVVEQAPGQVQRGGGQTGTQVDVGDAGAADALAGADGGHGPLHVPNPAHSPGALPDGGIEFALDGVVVGQRIHPGREVQVQLFHREFIEHPPDNIGHRVFLQLQAVGRHAGHVIPGGQVRPDGLGPLCAGIGGVEHHQEGLSQLFQLGDDPLLGLQIVLPGNVGDGAVGGDDNGDGGVLGDHLPGADFGGLGHGDVVVKPGGTHHAGHVVLHLAGGPGDHVAHAVDQPHRKSRPVLQRNFHRVLGDKLGLGGHDGPAGAALGQLIPGPLPAVDVFNIRDHHRLHEALDKRGFSGAHRPHNADIDIALRPQGDILIDLALFQLQFLLRPGKRNPAPEPFDVLRFSLYLWG